LKNSRNADVVLGHLCGSVGHEDNKISTRNGDLGLLPNVRGEMFLGPSLPASGVHDVELVACPLRVKLSSIARHSCLFVCDCCLATNDPVDKR